LALLLNAAGPDPQATMAMNSKSKEAEPFVVVLGIAQDGGYPQAGCARACCAPAWSDPRQKRHVACLAIVDPASHQRWMIDATPDFPAQLHMLDDIAPPGVPAPGMPGPGMPTPAPGTTAPGISAPTTGPGTSAPGLAGILLTHGHIGH